jgi:DNA-binding XRE family transcriptional regulator
MTHTRSPFCVEFGRRLARRRRILGLTQRDVGARIGLQRAHISQLESGGYQSMKLEQLARLAEVLQTSLDYLLLRTAEDPGPIPPRPCPAAGPRLDGTTPLPVTRIPERTHVDGQYSIRT